MRKVSYVLADAMCQACRQRHHRKHSTLPPLIRRLLPPAPSWGTRRSSDNMCQRTQTHKMCSHTIASCLHMFVSTETTPRNTVTPTTSTGNTQTPARPHPPSAQHSGCSLLILHVVLVGRWCSKGTMLCREEGCSRRLVLHQHARLHQRIIRT